MKYEELYLGQIATMEKSYRLEDVKIFSELSGDFNPVHLDDEFAQKTIFEKPIVHGFLYSSMFSALIANQLPGPGSVYVHQELNFKSPVFHNEIVVAEVKIIELKPEKKIVILETICKTKNNVEVLLGKAVIKLV